MNSLDLDYRNVKQKLLEEIAQLLKVTSDEVVAKVHSLRSQFNRESSKEKKQKSGAASEENYTSKWEPVWKYID